MVSISLVVHPCVFFIHQQELKHVLVETLIENYINEYMADIFGAQYSEHHISNHRESNGHGREDSTPKLIPPIIKDVRLSRTL